MRWRAPTAGVFTRRSRFIASDTSRLTARSMSALSHPRSPASSAPSPPAATATACAAQHRRAGEIIALEVVEAEVQAVLVFLAGLDLVGHQLLLVLADQRGASFISVDSGMLRMSILTYSTIGSSSATLPVSPVTSSSAKLKPWPTSSCMRVRICGVACIVSTISSTTFSRGRKEKMSVISTLASTLTKPSASPMVFSIPSCEAWAITAAVAVSSLVTLAGPTGALRKSNS
jgi:hypothetical protein